MNQHVQKKPRILIGTLVASGNNLRNIAATRLNVVVRYTNRAFCPRIIEEKIVGINTEKEKYRL